MILRIRRSLQIRGAAKEERHKTKKKAAVNVRRVEKSQHSSLVICNVQASSNMCRVRSTVQERKNTKTNATFIETVKCWDLVEGRDFSWNPRMVVPSYTFQHSSTSRFKQFKMAPMQCRVRKVLKDVLKDVLKGCFK